MPAERLSERDAHWHADDGCHGECGHQRAGGHPAARFVEYVADDRQGHPTEYTAESAREHSRSQEPPVSWGQSAGERSRQEASVESEERRPAGKAIQEDRCE